MNIFFRKILLACLVLISTGISATAQVGLSAMATPSEVGLDEYFNFKIIIENTTDVKDLTVPSFPYFTVIGEPLKESGVNSINGNVTRYIAVVFTLKPTHTGKFSIPPASARLNGKLYKSNLVMVTVSRQSSVNTNSPFAFLDPAPSPTPTHDYSDYILHKGENITEKVNRNMVLKLEVDKTTCYVGEPVVATYKLYTRLKSESKLSQNPSFNGFSVVDLTQGNGMNYSTGELNGKQYNVYVIRKSQLYPLQSGLIELEPAELENNLQFIKEGYAARQRNDLSNFFDDLSMGLPPDAIVNQMVVLKSKPVNITVKPLPEEGKPSSFNGAVGNFTLDVSLEKNKFSTDEAGMLSVTINGSGNMQLLTAPEIEWPTGIEAFDPKISDQLNNNSIPISGTKTFSFPFAANTAGEYIIPPVRFSYFDPKEGKYKMVDSKPIPFSVSKGPGNNIAFTGHVVHKSPAGFVNNIFNHRWWIVVFIGIMIITGLIIWLLRERKSTPVPEPVVKHEDSQLSLLLEESTINQQNPFAKTEQCLATEECQEFYTILNTELKNYLAHKFLLDPHEINNSSVAAMMDQRGISNETVLQLQSLMREIEWQLYTPFERTEKMNELYQQALQLCQTINMYSIRVL